MRSPRINGYRRARLRGSRWRYLKVGSAEGKARRPVLDESREIERRPGDRQESEGQIDEQIIEGEAWGDAQEIVGEGASDVIHREEAQHCPAALAKPSLQAAERDQCEAVDAKCRDAKDDEGPD